MVSLIRFSDITKYGIYSKTAPHRLVVKSEMQFEAEAYVTMCRVWCRVGYLLCWLCAELSLCSVFPKFVYSFISLTAAGVQCRVAVVKRLPLLDHSAIYTLFPSGSCKLIRGSPNPISYLWKRINSLLCL